MHRAELVQTIDIAGRSIGAGCPCFLIAEAGVNHNGDLGLAKQLVDAAADAGADAVKFQTFRAEQVAAEDAPKAPYQLQNTSELESQQEMLQRLELSLDAHRELKDHCRRRGILFLSSPFDLPSVDLLQKLELPAIKLGSGEVTNWPLLRRAAGTGKPVILSTGMADLSEVQQAVEQLTTAGCQQLLLLHCLTSYPADPQFANLRAIETMAASLQCPVGYSDHTPGIEVALAAVALGACVVEKHLTLDRGLPGPDQEASLEPRQWGELVRSVRVVEKCLGDGDKKPAPCELELAAIGRRSLVAACDLEPGMVVEPQVLLAVRPASGLAPNRIDEVVGRRLRTAVVKGQQLSLEHLL